MELCQNYELLRKNEKINYEPREPHEGIKNVYRLPGLKSLFFDTGELHTFLTNNRKYIIFIRAEGV
jgi:hypothetical protein